MILPASTQIEPHQCIIRFGYVSLTGISILESDKQGVKIQSNNSNALFIMPSTSGELLFQILQIQSKTKMCSVTE